MTFIHVGMSYFSLLSLFKTSNVYIIKVLYNATSTLGKIWNHFPFKLSEVRFRHSVMYQWNRSFNIPSPLPLSILRTFNAFSWPWGRVFDKHASGVGNLIGSLDFMLRVAPISIYRVIETRVDRKFGRTRNAMGTRATGERFHSFFEFSQTLTSVSITR